MSKARSKITAFYITLACSPLIGFWIQATGITLSDHKTQILAIWGKLNKILNGGNYRSDKVYTSKLIQ
jgi:uncharacterized BrkB/YihY/UPF0761 family membrane protein